MLLQYVQIFVDFYMLLLSSPMRRLPRAPSERIFVGTVCILSLNIVSLFQSSLATVFIKPVYYKNIDSLQQFAETGQRILIKYPAMLTDLFPEDSSNLFRTLNARMVLIAKPELTSQNITSSMNMASVTRKISARLSNEENVVHLVPECPRSYNLAYMLSKNSVYLERVNAIILDTQQFGLINKWTEEMNFRAKLDGMKKYPPVTGRARVLNINDIQLACIILSAGCFISLIVFVLEKCIKQKKAKKASNVRFIYLN